MQNKTALDYLIEAQDYITSMYNPNDRTEYQILKEIDILIQKAINHLEKTSEQKNGKWLKVSGYFTPGGDPVWMCSECGVMFNKNLIYDYTEKNPLIFKFCPCCGADMRCDR